MGLIYMEQGKLDQAILEFNFVLAANPKEDRVRYYLGAAYVEKDAFDQAVSEFKKIPPESTLFADSRRNIALILRKQNKTGEAIRILEESIQAKPNDGDLYMILAAVYEKENHLEKALSSLKKGLETNQNNVDIHFQLGALYDKMGDFEKMDVEMKRGSPAESQPCGCPQLPRLLLLRPGHPFGRGPQTNSEGHGIEDPIWATSPIVWVGSIINSGTMKEQ